MKTAEIMDRMLKAFMTTVERRKQSKIKKRKTIKSEKRIYENLTDTILIGDMNTVLGCKNCEIRGDINTVIDACPDTVVSGDMNIVR